VQREHADLAIIAILAVSDIIGAGVALAVLPEQV